jgi:hypothetical protein
MSQELTMMLERTNSRINLDDNENTNFKPISVKSKAYLVDGKN